MTDPAAPQTAPFPLGPGFAGRRYAVLGLARSGLAAARALAAAGAEVLAWDRDEQARAGLESSMERDSRDRAEKVRFGDPAQSDLSGFAAVVISPGVPLNRHPIAVIAGEAGVPLIGDIELFAQARRSLPTHRLVGITGTNGKSTTTALVAHVLSEAGLAARMGGNIGIPVLDGAPLPAGGVYVLELSSYQLDLIRSLDCEVAALLNITPDHLDRYAGLTEYQASKARLLAMQSPAGCAVVDAASLAGVPAVAEALEGRGPVVIDRVALPGEQSNWPALQGPHNRANAAAAVAICRALGVAAEVIERSLASFAGLPHRMQPVATIDDVSFINDSKATNPASTAPALAAFPPAADGRPRIHWIVGGLPKGDRLDECAPCFGNVAAAYTIGEAGPAFSALLEEEMKVVRSELLSEAVRAAKSAARPGDVVLLSPACASFDQFGDFERRGQAFIDMVAALGEDSAGDIRPIGAGDTRAGDAGVGDAGAADAEGDAE